MKLISVIFACGMLIPHCLIFICCTIIGCKLFYNLYIIEHNWIIEPSLTTKTTSLLSCISFALCGLGYSILAILFFTNFDYNIWIWLQIIPNSFDSIGVFTYYYFLLSIINDYGRVESLFSIMVSIKFVNFLKIIVCIKMLISCLLWIVNLTVDWGQFIFLPYTTWEAVIEITCTPFILLSLLYIYYRGLNNIANWWYSKHWQEYEQYGENQRTHEILLKMSRCTVMVTISATFHLIYDIYGIISTLQITPSLSVQLYVSNMCLRYIFSAICFIIDALSIYFIYEFGYQSYEKICKICHDKMYDLCQKRHQKKIQNGEYVVLDGVSNK